MKFRMKLEWNYETRMKLESIKKKYNRGKNQIDYQNPKHIDEYNHFPNSVTFRVSDRLKLSTFFNRID